MRIKDLKPIHLQSIIASLTKQGYSQKTMRTVVQSASQVIELAMQNDIVFRNVFSKISVPKTESEERQPITSAQKLLVQTTYRDHRMGVPALIMLYCGLRRGELIALTWRDIDFDKRLLSVDKAADMPRNQPCVKAPKTKAGVRSIPIPTAILPALAEAKKQATSFFVAPSVRAGGMMSVEAFRRGWESYMHHLNLAAGGSDKKRGSNDENGKATFLPAVIAMEPFTAHQLRHTYATMLYDAGVDIKTAQKLLGHSDIQVTMKIYTHLSEEKQQQAVNALNAHVSAELAPIFNIVE